MLRSASKMKRYVLVFFTDQFIHGVCPTSAIVVGLAAPVQDIVVWWNKKHPSTKARIVKLSSFRDFIFFSKRCVFALVLFILLFWFAKLFEKAHFCA